VLPFAVSLRTGLPIHEQVIYAVTRAIVSGQLRAGDPFPSVRSLSPNTAHRVVAALIEDDLLVVRPGIGTFVAGVGPVASGARRLVLGDDAERMVVAAKRAGISLQDVLAAVRRHWTRNSEDD
jgi:GntR family transcriptional regulator